MTDAECRRAQPTMDGTIPSQVGLGYIRKMTEDEDVESWESASLLASAPVSA